MNKTDVVIMQNTEKHTVCLAVEHRILVIVRTGKNYTHNTFRILYTLLHVCAINTTVTSTCVPLPCEYMVSLPLLASGFYCLVPLARVNNKVESNVIYCHLI